MKVISRSKLGTVFPWHAFAVWYLLLVHFDAPGWVWGIVGTLAGILLIACIVSIVKEEKVDPFEEFEPRKKLPSA